MVENLCGVLTSSLPPYARSLFARTTATNLSPSPDVPPRPPPLPSTNTPAAPFPHSTITSAADAESVFHGGHGPASIMRNILFGGHNKRNFSKIIVKLQQIFVLKIPTGSFTRNILRNWTLKRLFCIIDKFNF